MPATKKRGRSGLAGDGNPYTGRAAKLGHVLLQAEHVQECLLELLEDMYAHRDTSEAAVTVSQIVWEKLQEARKLCDIWEGEAVESAIAETRAVAP